MVDAGEADESEMTREELEKYIERNYITAAIIDSRNKRH